MSENYINEEVNKIINSKDKTYPQNWALACAWILGNLKGINLKVLNVQGISSLTEYFVMASAQNLVQAKAMASEIVKQYKHHEVEILSIEGMQSGSDWVLIDTGDIIVHIFLDVSREIYNLENLWSKAEEVEIPQSYYFSAEQDGREGGSGNDEKEYF